MTVCAPGVWSGEGFGVDGDGVIALNVDPFLPHGETDVPFLQLPGVEVVHRQAQDFARKLGVVPSFFFFFEKYV